MISSCDHAVLTEGWVKEQGKEAALMEAWGNCHHLFWLLIWCSPCLLQLQKLHIYHGSHKWGLLCQAAKKLIPSPVQSWVWFVPKDQQLSGVCPSRPWDHPGSDNKAIQWEALCQPSCHMGIHIHLGCLHYLTGSSFALIQLFQCLCLVGLGTPPREGKSHL